MAAAKGLLEVFAPPLRLPPLGLPGALEAAATAAECAMSTLRLMSCSGSRAALALWLRLCEGADGAGGWGTLCEAIALQFSALWYFPSILKFKKLSPAHSFLAASRSKVN